MVAYRSRAGGCAALAVVAVLGLAGCGSVPDQPVAQLEAQPAALALPYPGSARLGLSWEPIAPLGEVVGELLVFVHLLDAQGVVVRTFDHPFPARWEVGRTFAYPLEIHQSTLGPALPAGTYSLTAGLYDTAGRRWALTTGGEEIGRQEYRLAGVEVPVDELEEVPELAYAGDWMAPEEGVDRQILGRRWFTGPARVAVDGVGARGEIVFSLSLPRPPPDAELRLAEGAGEAAVKVVSTCDGSQHTFTGTGTRDFAVAVAPGEPCEVVLRPSFHLVWADGRPPMSAFLQGVYWRAGEPPPAAGR